MQHVVACSSMLHQTVLQHAFGVSHIMMIQTKTVSSATQNKHHIPYLQMSLPKLPQHCCYYKALRDAVSLPTFLATKLTHALQAGPFCHKNLQIVLFQFYLPSRVFETEIFEHQWAQKVSQKPIHILQGTFWVA